MRSATLWRATVKENSKTLFSMSVCTPVVPLGIYPQRPAMALRQTLQIQIDSSDPRPKSVVFDQI